MAELVDAADSKSAVRKDVQVRFLFRARIIIISLDSIRFQGFFISGKPFIFIGQHPSFSPACLRIHEHIIFKKNYFDKPAITLIVSATITVLKAKDKMPCNNASLRNRFEVTSTSDTWNVIPRTKEKYAKSK